MRRNRRRFCSVIVFLMAVLMVSSASFAQSGKEEFDRAVALFNDGQNRLNRSDLHGAVRQWEGALAVFQKLNQKRAVGTTVGNLGIAYSYLGDYRKAISCYKQALAIAEETGNRQGKGSILGNLGLAHVFMGDFRKGISYYEQALVIAKEGSNRKNEGIWVGNLGIAYGYLGDFRKAISYYEQALAIAEQIGDQKTKGFMLGNMGHAYRQMGDFRKAVSCYEQTLAILERIGDKQGKGMSLGSLGLMYGYLGDHRKAVAYYEQALAIAEEIGDKNSKAAFLGNLGTAYSDLGNYQEAISCYEKALAVAIEIGEKNTQGSCLSNLANAYSLLGDYGRAITYYEKALAVLKQIGVPYVVTENNLADAYLALDRDGEAFAIYQKNDVPIRLGRFYLKKKQFGKAIEQFDRGRQADEQQRAASFIIARWIGLGLSYEGRQEYEAAYGWYTKATVFMEEQRASLTPAEREHYFEGTELRIPRIEAYEGAVRCAFQLGRFEEAFYWSENTRGRVLSELLSRRHAGASYKIPVKLAQEEEELTTRMMINKKQQLTAFQKANMELSRKAESDSLVLKQKMENLIDRLRKDYPQYAAVKYPKPVKLSQLALKKGETIIEYEVTAPYTIGLVIRDGKVVRGFRVEKTRAELENLVRRFRAPFQPGQDPNEFSLKLAKELTDLLIRPALAELKKGGHLIVAPDESLSLLPFEALLLDASVQGVMYVMDEYPVSYYQSASVLSLQRGLHIARVKKPAFFGLGDPIFDARDERSAGLRAATIVEKKTASTNITGSEGAKDSGYRFSRLENTALEVKQVSSLFPDSRILIGPDASKENLKKEDLKSRRYILFSTHGVLGNEIPYIKQPALILNLVGNRQEEGFLTASEIFNMDLNADLVCLSACQTGLGIQSAGEGVVGLSRAFMYAGTNSVLVSLWSVSDESTYRLMVRFFELLKQGKNKLTALNDAKQYLRTSGYDNPFYWAPFILVGEAN